MPPSDLEAIDQQLSAAKEMLQQKEKTARRLQSINEELQQERSDLQQHLDRLAKEQHDVDALDAMTLTNLFTTILGNKEERRSKEQEELLMAKLAADHKRRLVARLEDEKESLKQQLEGLKNAEQAYQEALSAKAKALTSLGGNLASQLEELDQERAGLAARLREIKEAARAGRTALDWLVQVQSSLESARLWGTWDLLGGDLIATAVKRSRMNNANAKISETQHALQRFARELRDVPGLQASVDSMETGGFLAFADYFFDGLISDWMVQSKINRSLDQVKDCKRQVQRVLDQLKARTEETQEQHSKLEERRTHLIATA